jgi:hypothetical protein
MYSNIGYIYTFALTKINSRVMRLQLQECVNSKGILFTIYRHKTQPVRNYILLLSRFAIPKLHEQQPSVITCRQLKPKLFLPAGPSATKHGPNNSLTFFGVAGFVWGFA